MHYTFPHITNLADVLPAIKDCPEFVVSPRPGGYTVVNYQISTENTFPPVTSREDAIKRECRGLIFDTKTGNILHRRLHKFFNVNERDETQLRHVDFNKHHVILEKLDGSMITPVWTDEGLRWGTKMGVTEVAGPVEDFVKKNWKYTAFVEALAESGTTPIFEWCSRKQRIVVDYPVDQLVLIAMRQNITGAYIGISEMRALASTFDIPVVMEYAGTAQNMEALLASTRSMEDAEGFVVRFDDGHMVKVKGEWYVERHRAKDGIRFEKNVISALLTETIDDLKSFLLDDDRVRVEAYAEKFWDGVFKTARSLEARYHFGYNANRKTFAVEFVLKQDRCYQGFLFDMYKGGKPLDLLKRYLLAHCGSQTSVDEARWIHGSVWNTSEE